MKKGIADALKNGISELYPGYFALVMATGIVSIAMYLWRIPLVAWALFGMNLFAYLVLWVLTLARAFRFSPQLMADLTSHSRGPGFLTLVASTCIVGSQFVILGGDNGAGTALWTGGLLLWFVLVYAFLTAIVIRQRKPDLETGLNGGWLVTVVSTQSLSILGTLLSPFIEEWGDAQLFVALAMFLLGSALYLLLISLIFYRLTFFTLTPAEFRPPYWINMGAIAITTLAGSTLILNNHRWDFLGNITPFLQGLTLFFWVMATWWIPLLIILELWRYLDRRYPVRYDPRDWDIVFPLGMYAVSTFELSQATTLSFLLPISEVFAVIAAAAWAVVLIGLVRQLVRRVRST